MGKLTGSGSGRRVRLIPKQFSLLRLCNNHPSKRMWVWKTLKAETRQAMALARKGLIAADGELEGSYRMTQAGINVANDQGLAAARSGPKTN